MKKPYNTTDLSIDKSLERHIYHRDIFAHYLRWSHILKFCAKIKDESHIVDFGCGATPLFELLYRNRMAPDSYHGVDIRRKIIESSRDKFTKIPGFNVTCCDIIKDVDTLAGIKGNLICSFEVMEHVGKQNGEVFLQNFKNLGVPGATYFLSTPCYDPQVGAAGNHTYDSGDGQGVMPQEFTQDELIQLLSRDFEIVNAWGTFASMRDYLPHLTEAELSVFNKLREYYDSNLMSVIFAPLYPKYARNVIYELKAKTA